VARLRCPFLILRWGCTGGIVVIVAAVSRTVSGSSGAWPGTAAVPRNHRSAAYFPARAHPTRRAAWGPRACGLLAVAALQISLWLRSSASLRPAGSRACR